MNHFKFLIKLSSCHSFFLRVFFATGARWRKEPLLLPIFFLLCHGGLGMQGG